MFSRRSVGVGGEQTLSGDAREGLQFLEPLGQFFITLLLVGEGQGTDSLSKP